MEPQMDDIAGNKSAAMVENAIKQTNIRQEIEA